MDDRDRICLMAVPCRFSNMLHLSCSWRDKSRPRLPPSWLGHTCWKAVQPEMIANMPSLVSERPGSCGSRRYSLPTAASFYHSKPSQDRCETRGAGTVCPAITMVFGPVSVPCWSEVGKFGHDQPCKRHILSCIAWRCCGYECTCKWKRASDLPVHAGIRSAAPVDGVSFSFSFRTTQL